LGGHILEASLLTIDAGSTFAGLVDFGSWQIRYRIGLSPRHQVMSVVQQRRDDLATGVIGIGHQHNGLVPNECDRQQQRHKLAQQGLGFPIGDTAVADLTSIVQLCNEKKIPLFAGDVDSVAAGAVAAYGLDYYLVGYSAGKKAGLILKGSKPGDIPWGPVKKFSLVINQKAAALQGVTLAFAGAVVPAGSALPVVADRLPGAPPTASPLAGRVTARSQLPRLRHRAANWKSGDWHHPQRLFS